MKRIETIGFTGVLLFGWGTHPKSETSSFNGHLFKGLVVSLISSCQTYHLIGLLVLILFDWRHLLESLVEFHQFSYLSFSKLQFLLNLPSLPVLWYLWLNVLKHLLKLEKLTSSDHWLLHPLRSFSLNRLSKIVLVNLVYLMNRRS